MCIDPPDPINISGAGVTCIPVQNAVRILDFHIDSDLGAALIHVRSVVFRCFVSAVRQLASSTAPKRQRRLLPVRPTCGCADPLAIGSTTAISSWSGHQRSASEYCNRFSEQLPVWGSGCVSMTTSLTSGGATLATLSFRTDRLYKVAYMAYQSLDDSSIGLQVYLYRF